MKNIPPKIYLQIGESEHIEDFKKLSGITWCDDNIHETDIEYVEAGRVKKLVDELEEIKGKIEQDFIKNGDNELTTIIHMEIGIALNKYLKEK